MKKTFSGTKKYKSRYNHVRSRDNPTYKQKLGQIIGGMKFH